MKPLSLLPAVQAFPLYVDIAHSWCDGICLKPWVSSKQAAKVMPHSKQAKYPRSSFFRTFSESRAGWWHSQGPYRKAGVRSPCHHPTSDFWVKSWHIQGDVQRSDQALDRAGCVPSFGNTESRATHLPGIQAANTRIKDLVGLLLLAHPWIPANTDLPVQPVQRWSVWDLRRLGPTTAWCCWGR